MDATSATSGVCPHCRQLGDVGTPCTEKVCAKRGYHRVTSDVLPDGRVAPEIGLLIAGRYLLERLLGEGGFGRVFVGRQPSLENRKVAVKIVKMGGEENLHDIRVNSFRQEAAAMSRLPHPNIVQIYDFGFFEDAAYLVLEFVDGGVTLKDELRQRQQENRDLTIAEVETILGGVLNGLEAVHRLGVVHRDIKPENVMLQNKPGHPCLPRLLDFGLAKHVDAETQSLYVLGTLAYMAPEQLTKTDLGAWTDLYALGVMAYELMTGVRPFRGTDREIQVNKGDPTFDVLAPIARYDVPEPIRSFLKRALAHDPTERYRSTTEFRTAMESAFRAAHQRGATEGTSTQAVPPAEVHAATPPARATHPSRAGVLPPVATGRASAEPPAARPRGPMIAVGIGAIALVVVLLVVPSDGKGSNDATGPNVLVAPILDASPTIAPSTTGEHDVAGPTSTVEPSAPDVAPNYVEVPDTTIRALNPAPDGSGVARAPAGYARIERGRFTMGSPSGEVDRDDDEKQHEVLITQAFYLKLTEVTQAEWRATMGENPSGFAACGDDCPVEQVSWWDAIAFVNRLSEREGLARCYETDGSFVGLSCSGYRLPTEAEWEYAARAGHGEARYGSLDAVAWWMGNSDGKTHPVARDRLPNAWGLFDMLGNVWEWVHDRKGSYDSEAKDPMGSTLLSRSRVVRGGSWRNSAKYVRAADRRSYDPKTRSNEIGLRPARSVR